MVAPESVEGDFSELQFLYQVLRQDGSLSLASDFLMFLDLTVWSLTLPSMVRLVWLGCG